jgi:hypothetical protein
MIALISRQGLFARDVSRISPSLIAMMKEAIGEVGYRWYFNNVVDILVE